MATLSDGFKDIFLAGIGAAEDVAASVRYDVLEARMAAMTLEERAAFVAKAAEFAEKANAKSASEAEVGDASAVSVDDEAASAAAPQTPGA